MSKSAVVALVFSLFLIAEHGAADEQPRNVEDLTAALTAELTSIKSLMANYTIDQARIDGTKSRRLLTIARAGDKWHYGEQSEVENGIRRSIVCCNGKHRFSYVTYELIGETRIGTVQVHDAHENESTGPEHMLGVKIFNLSRSIVDILATPGSDATVAPESKGPDKVFRMKLSNVITNDPNVAKGTKLFDLEVVVDPAHGHLLRELDLKPVGKTNFRQTWTMTRFREFRDESTNVNRWFPVEAQLDQQSSIGRFVSTMTVTDVRVNPVLPPMLFTPLVPNGTSIADVTTNGTRKIGVKGGPGDVDQRVTEMLDDALPAIVD